MHSLKATVLGMIRELQMEEFLANIHTLTNKLKLLYLNISIYRIVKEKEMNIL